MPVLIHQSITAQALTCGDTPALILAGTTLNYRQLNDAVIQLSHDLLTLGLKADDRVAVYLPKKLETVISLFAASHAGGVMVPINPLLKPPQLAHICHDCSVKVLVTSAERWQQLLDADTPLPSSLSHVLITPSTNPTPHPPCSGIEVIPWHTLHSPEQPPHLRIDTDMAAILYTSGSTGKPKGVILSHRNLCAGASSVASYLGNTRQDKLLAVLPLSFDYGLSQLTCAFEAGACVVLMDYLLPRDVIKAVQYHQITALAAVPPLWNQLAQLDWPANTDLRYITNSGGAMPSATTAALRRKLPSTEIYLMYGLTEAFRSTYLPPEQLDIRPDSIGKAIPNARVWVVRSDGSECDVDEPGELVHTGALVAMGYWNDVEKTAQRFKPSPQQLKQLPLTEMAVWSGDRVRRDADGYLYFIARQDEMIKTSGYRVSPSEIEEVIQTLPAIDQVVAIGVPHPALGQAILVVISLRNINGSDIDSSDTKSEPIAEQTIFKHCRQQLPNFMVPLKAIIRAQLPRNPNGKIDRSALYQSYQNTFEEGSDGGT